MQTLSSHVGIDAMAFYVPPIYLDLQTLAKARQLDYDKLSKGLGVLKMALPDKCEDAASMAANAVWKLLTTYHINPQHIGRLYVGTESGVDGAKPLASYVVGMLNDKLNATATVPQSYFGNCDAIDMTFACIGAVDALHNTIDWVRGGTDRVGIVVATDYAKYEKLSGGEYTQGAGAVAMLVTHHPRLLVIHDSWGVAMQSEHDFFKPQFSETPVFDGHFSNDCYQNRLKEAYQHFKRQSVQQGRYTDEDMLSEKWDNLIFHLPYAFHGKRMFVDLFTEERLQASFVTRLATALQTTPEELLQLPIHDVTKMVAKSDMYQQFVTKKIAAGQKASSQIGNMYTASIFMALMSCLVTKTDEKQDLTHQTVGFCAYGSGSKAKVFEGQIQPRYKEIVEKFGLFELLATRLPISQEDYEDLHDKKLCQPLTKHAQSFVLKAIANNPAHLHGARYYEWQEA